MSNNAVGSDKKMYYADRGVSYSGDFFCPGCGCKMILKNPKHPYFSASKSAPHSADCEYKTGCVSSSALKTAGFDVADFFDRLALDGSDGSSKSGGKDGRVFSGAYPIRTVNQLWLYCKQHADNHVLPDGTKVSEIYQEKRNSYIKDWNRKRERLILLGFRNCNFKDFDVEKGCFKVWCYFPHNENTVPPAFYYTLGFSGDKHGTGLMGFFCEKLYQLKERIGHAYLVVGGTWKSRHCHITSKKQIHILNE